MGRRLKNPSPLAIVGTLALVGFGAAVVYKQNKQPKPTAKKKKPIGGSCASRSPDVHDEMEAKGLVCNYDTGEWESSGTPAPTPETTYTQAQVLGKFLSGWTEGAKVYAWGWIPAQDNRFSSSDEFFAIVEAPAWTGDIYSAMWTQDGGSSTSRQEVKNFELAEAYVMDGVNEPVWTETCPSPQRTSIGWRCITAAPGETWARGFEAAYGAGREAPYEWRVQKTANPNEPFVAQYRLGVDLGERENRKWNFAGSYAIGSQAEHPASTAGMSAAYDSL